MTSYDQIDDEDQLHEMMSKVENFEERKKIRARIREIREKKLNELEERRIENEKIANDALKEKVRRADEEKERKMQAYKEQSNITAVMEDRRLQTSQDCLKERQSKADEDKRKKLEFYDQIAKKENEAKMLATGDKKDGAVEKAKEDDGKPKETTETTTVTSKDGKTTTVTTVQTITDKNETRIITTEVATKTMPDGGTSTKTSKRTKIIQNQMGFGGGMAAPGGLAPAGRGRGLTRSPSAIKQMLLQWAKAMTQEYSDKITITNFSSSWNNGIAFCALIHHFFPDAFDFDALDPKKRRHNFDLAFKTAEKMADIAPLLDTEDMMRMKNPDWKCVFTYVQSMYQKLQSHANNKAMPLPEKPAS